MKLLAWLGSIALALCALPQAIKCVRDRSAAGLSWWFLGLWTVGELCMLGYALGTRQTALAVNYGANLALLAVMWRYKCQNTMS